MPGKTLAQRAGELSDALQKLLPSALGLGILIVFAVFVRFLLNNTGASDSVWNRFIYVFSAVQSIALAAATFFFGKTVNAQAEKASDAKKAKDIATDGLLQVLSDAEKNARDQERQQRDGVVPTEHVYRGLENLSRSVPDLQLRQPEFLDHVRKGLTAVVVDHDDGAQWRDIAATARRSLDRANAVYS